MADISKFATIDIEDVAAISTVDIADAATINGADVPSAGILVYDFMNGASPDTTKWTIVDTDPSTYIVTTWTGQDLKCDVNTAPSGTNYTYAFETKTAIAPSSGWSIQWDTKQDWNISTNYQYLFLYASGDFNNLSSHDQARLMYYCGYNDTQFFIRDASGTTLITDNNTNLNIQDNVYKTSKLVWDGINKIMYAKYWNGSSWVTANSYDASLDTYGGEDMYIRFWVNSGFQYAMSMYIKNLFVCSKDYDTHYPEGMTVPYPS